RKWVQLPPPAQSAAIAVLGTASRLWTCSSPCWLREAQHGRI
ncbi:hypothetical protein A2U01_0031518, partial [Trifolium medium]|nr:hypothetical protein [Trifolium medium]